MQSYRITPRVPEDVTAKHAPVKGNRKVKQREAVTVRPLRRDSPQTAKTPLGEEGEARAGVFRPGAAEEVTGTDGVFRGQCQAATALAGLDNAGAGSNGEGKEKRVL